MICSFRCNISSFIFMNCPPPPQTRYPLLIGLLCILFLPFRKLLRVHLLVFLLPALGILIQLISTFSMFSCVRSSLSQGRGSITYRWHTLRRVSRDHHPTHISLGLQTACPKIYRKIGVRNHRKSSLLCDFHQYCSYGPF